VTTIEFPTHCRCGRAYVTTLGGALYCENCDSPQVRELLGMQRMRTREDIRYDLYWLSVMGQEYPPVPDDWSGNTNEEEDDE
jgi:hypothetical protein